MWRWICWLVRLVFGVWVLNVRECVIERLSCFDCVCDCDIFFFPDDLPWELGEPCEGGTIWEGGGMGIGGWDERLCNVV